MDTDYLVIGAGLAGMAFTDALIAESDARVLMVDRRHGPGGHWNDAYPFVRLHQPSAFYGVPSRNLGEDRIDDTGPNAGFYERATAAEVCHYFQEVMDETFLPSGQVDFRPMSDVQDRGDGTATITNRLTGATTDVTVRKKVVDARYLESAIPATHTPSFTVDDGARCVPVNALVKEAEPAGGYVVLGAGKTAMDACVWLLEQGVDPTQHHLGEAPRAVAHRPQAPAAARAGGRLHQGLGQLGGGVGAGDVGAGPVRTAGVLRCAGADRQERRGDDVPRPDPQRVRARPARHHRARRAARARPAPPARAHDDGRRRRHRPGRRPVRRLHRRGPAVTAAPTDLRARADHAAGHPGGQPVVQRRARSATSRRPAATTSRPPTS